jgi:hypothetical protein
LNLELGTGATGNLQKNWVDGWWHQNMFSFVLHYLNALMIFKAEVHEFSEFVGCQDKGETGVTHTFLPWESQI